jgi:DNA topoisomerase-1
MKKLVITEKANAARRIAAILSRGSYETNKRGNVSVLEFDVDGDDISIIGLRGHIIELDYPKELNDWRSVDVKDLVYAPPEKSVRAQNILDAIADLADRAEEVIIATDFDREGELIGLETVKLIGIDLGKVKRARFSALTKQEIDSAFSQLTEPDERLADAAEARQVIDLAWGAVLTRFISITSGQVGRNFLSVGRVQSPTLGLIVDRHREIEEFVPRPYWNIHAAFRKGEEFSGNHQGNPFWEQKGADEILEKCKGKALGRVDSFEVKERDEYPPSPFSTTAMLAEANRIGISPGAAMKLAEDLYTSGYISYPRTDNTVYPRSLNLRTILNKFTDSAFSKEVGEILSQETIRPSRGKKSTTDHPPIYPTEVANPNKIKGDKWKLYELITRRFLATVSPSAKVEDTECVMSVGGEAFDCKGNKYLNLGWRKHYPYWKVRESFVPRMEVGEDVEIVSVGKEALETKPPARYNQGNLIQEMERLGLGTKSTRHDLIGKLYSRNYVQGNNMIPTPSGAALIDSLEKHAHSITESKMTSGLEEDMERISIGESTLNEVVKESQDMLSDVVTVLKEHEGQIGKEIRSALQEQNLIGKCPKCGGELKIRRSRKGNFIGCSNYPECTVTYPIPRGALVETTEATCEVCGAPKLRVIRRGQRPLEQCVDPKCESNTSRTTIGTCPKCGGDIRMMFSKAGKRFAGCSNWPNCDQTYPLPPIGVIVAKGESCPECGSPMIEYRKKMQCINMECPTRAKEKKKGKKK